MPRPRMPSPARALSRALAQLRRANALLCLDALPAVGSARPVQVTLQPLEPLQVQRGRLQLLLVETYFARTVLDGFHEQATERVVQTLEICGRAAVGPDTPLNVALTVRIPESAPAPSEARPARLQWLARARFDFTGRRSLRASRVLADPTPANPGAPQVDGRGFLPL